MTRLLLIALAVAAPATLHAQIDYRNLDDGRPSEVEDAYPVERHAFEFVAPWRTRHADGVTTHLFAPELEYGVVMNGEMGVKVVGAGINGPAGSDIGLAGIGVGGLYSLNTESPSLPAAAIRAEVLFPAGALAGSDVRGLVKLILTRNLGALRLHANAARGIGPEDAMGLAAPPRWFAGIAAERTFIRHSFLVIADLHGEQEARGAPVAVNAGLGARWQWSPTTVLDAGIARRLRTDAGPEFALTVGLAHAFGIAALMGGTP